MPNIVKIGATSGSPARRAQKLSQLTAVPAPFAIIFSQPVTDMHGVEARIFRVLQHYRRNRKREYFNLNPVEAVRMVRTILVEALLNKPEQGDGEILAWILASRRNKHTTEEIAAWSAAADVREPDADSREFFDQYLSECGPNRPDIKTRPDLLDLDDFVSFGGRA